MRWLAGRPARGAPVARTQPRRFGLLLLLLLGTYLISAFTSGAVVSLIQIVLYGLAAVVTLVGSAVRPRTMRVLLILELTGTVVAAVLALTGVSQIGSGLANLWGGLVLLFTVVIIVRMVLGMSTVTVQSIFGAVSAYLILGLMFATFYSAMYHFGGNEFFAGGRTGNTQTFQYFSFTTLTTLGYGDYTAAQSSGQAVAVIEALAGQVFLATLVARLVASFRGPAAPASTPAPRARPRPGRTNAGIDRHGTIATRRRGTGRTARESGRSGDDSPPPGRPPSGSGGG